MAVISNDVPMGAGFDMKSAVPLDGRTIVKVKQDLIDASKWDPVVEFYEGLPVYVEGTDEVYYLVDKTHALVNNVAEASEEAKNAAYACWQKMASYKRGNHSA